MNKKLLLITGSVLIIMVVCLFVWSAYMARQKSADILTRFNSVNESLTKANDSLVYKNDSLLKMDGVGAFKQDTLNH